MGYVMVTGPMGSGKSTFMRGLPKPWKEFIVPPDVPDMMLDHSCRLNGMMFYEIDAPTATGKVWIDSLKVANIQIVVGDGLEKPDENFIELWDYLVDNTPSTMRIIVLNRTNKISNEWANYSKEKMMCVGFGEVIDEETALASEEDIASIIEYLEKHE